MKKLYDEISMRFPEVNVDEGDIDLSYLLMREIVFWLQSKKTDCEDPNIIKRVIDFKKWCETQSRGKSADDDISTIFTVAFYEKLFENKKTQCLIPHLTSRKEIIQNRKYLIGWIGKDNYEEVLKKIKK